MLKSLCAAIVKLHRYIPSLMQPSLLLAADAILGVTYFSDHSPEEFGAFDRAFITMFRLLSGDAWVQGIPLVDPLGGVNARVRFLARSTLF